MKSRNIKYFSRNKAMKIIERPIEADLRTLLSATFALTRSNVVKKHIQSTLQELTVPGYKLSA